jgi:hypothetical protein
VRKRKKKDNVLEGSRNWQEEWREEEGDKQEVEEGRKKSGGQTKIRNRRKQEEENRSKKW